MKVQKVKYIRHGSCTPEKCGALCCRLMQNPSLETAEVFRPVRGVCQYLEGNDCSLHLTNKPSVCKIFPSILNPYNKTYLKVKHICGYSFERVVEEYEVKDQIGISESG